MVARGALLGLQAYERTISNTAPTDMTTFFNNWQTQMVSQRNSLESDLVWFIARTPPLPAEDHHAAIQLVFRLILRTAGLQQYINEFASAHLLAAGAQLQHTRSSGRLRLNNSGAQDGTALLRELFWANNDCLRTDVVRVARLTQCDDQFLALIGCRDVSYMGPFTLKP